MGHSIVAYDSEGRQIASMEFSFGGIDMLRTTGFDVYALYNASHCDKGVSGSGEDVHVDRQTAERALACASSWVHRVRNRYAELFGESPDEAAENEPDVRVSLSPVGGDFDWDALFERSGELDNEAMDEDEVIEYACDVANDVVTFTHRVAEGVAKGEVMISFA